MKFASALLLAFGIGSAVAESCSGPWGQCGGINFNGSSCCVSGYKCNYLNDWYSQCVPGSSSGGNTGNTTTTTTRKTTSMKTTTKKTSSVRTTTTTKRITTTTSSAAGTFVPSKPAGSSLADGFASMNGGCTGGAGGKVISVSSAAEFASAVAGDEAKIVTVNGILKLSADVSVGSNTSIVGSGSTAGITGAGLNIRDVNNVIVQNLKFSFCLGANKDCINAQRANNIWVDHNEFFSDRDHGKDYYDGLVDFTHACDYLTVSYNYIHDHYKASLVGHTDGNAAEDTGKFHITYHHNYFKNINSRLPSLRFGTGHIYNNLYENVDSSCANIRMGAQALVESNVYINAKRPVATNVSSKQEGSAVERNNDFGSRADTVQITNVGSFTTAPYSVNIDSTSTVQDKVLANVGVGKI